MTQVHCLQLEMEQLKNGVTFKLLTHVTIETTKHTLMNTKINTKLF